MKEKHFQAHLAVCRVIAAQSSCPRRAFGAVLVNPTRNTILATGYNGGPRGGAGTLCRDWFCERDGISAAQLVPMNGTMVRRNYPDGRAVDYVEGEPIVIIDRMLRAYPPIPSGTRMELGCHHAEQNAIANAAADGIATAGAWLFVTGEPCLMCAKLLHHCGVATVVVVEGGYAGGDAGCRYLEEHGVIVRRVEGEKDPRL